MGWDHGVEILSHIDVAHSMHFAGTGRFPLVLRVPVVCSEFMNLCSIASAVVVVACPMIDAMISAPLLPRSSTTLLPASSGTMLSSRGFPQVGCAILLSLLACVPVGSPTRHKCVHAGLLLPGVNSFRAT